MRMKNLQDASIDNALFLEKSCRKMYTIFSAVQRQQRKSDVMTSLDLTACSAVYYHAEFRPHRDRATMLFCWTCAIH
jgi:hypothetical protein